MVELATERMEEKDAKKRVEMGILKQEIWDSRSLLEARRRKHASRTTYHGGKLPVEIFAEIFTLVFNLESREAIVVSHVCKHWRAVAISTPALWRTLILGKKNPAGRAKLWMARSQGRIRELSIRETFENSRATLSSALDGFAWAHLRICRIEGENTIRQFNELIADLSTSHILSDVIEVELTCTSEHRNAFPFRYDLLNPRLQSLALRSQVVDWTPLSDQFTQLISLVVEDSLTPLPGSVYTVLEQNPMLESLLLRTVDMTGAVQTPFALSCLMHLDIAGGSLMEFCKITTPALQTLRLARVSHGGAQFLGGLYKSGPVYLTELSIRSVVVDATAVIQLLQAAPLLETLIITHMGLEINDVVEVLSAPNRTSYLLRPAEGPPLRATHICPLLTHIDFSSSPHLRSRAVINLVKSRFPVEPPTTPDDAIEEGKRVKPIEVLILDKCPLIEVELLRWLRSRVGTVSCVYATAKEAKWKR